MRDQSIANEAHQIFHRFSIKIKVMLSTDEVRSVYPFDGEQSKSAGSRHFAFQSFLLPSRLQRIRVRHGVRRLDDYLHFMCAINRSIAHSARRSGLDMDI